MSRRWRRNQRLKCQCGGYWFPHRRGGGACDTSPTMVFHRSLRQGMSREEALLEQGWQAPRRATECPF